MHKTIVKKNYKKRINDFSDKKNILKNILLFFLQQSVVEMTFGAFTIVMLWLIHLFSVPSTGTIVRLSIVIGLSQIIFGFILGTATAAGTGTSTLFGRNMKNDISVRKSIVDNGKIFLIFWTALLLIIVGVAGKYVVFSQNTGLPQEYKNLIEKLLYFYIAIIPAVSFLYYMSNNLSLEGHSIVPVSIGLYTLLSFVIFSLILFYGGAFSNLNYRYDLTNPIHLNDYVKRVIYIFGISIVLSFYTCAIFFYFYYRRLIKIKNTAFIGTTTFWKNFDWKYIYAILQLAISIFIRNLGIIVTVYIAYIGMRFIPIPSNSLRDQATFPNNALYWQYVSSSFLPILVIIICFSSALCRSNRFILSRALENNDRSYLNKFLKIHVIVSFIIGLFCSVFIIIIAPYLLSSLGVRNGETFSFVYNNTTQSYVGYKLNDHATIALRISIATVSLEFLTALVIPHSLVTHKMKSLFIAVSLRNILLFIPLFLLFCYLSGVANFWYLAWIGYNVIDIIFGIISIYMFYRFYILYKKTKKLNDLIYEY